VRRGRVELDDPEPLPVGRSRGPGGGRRRAEGHDPDLPAALDKLVDPDSRGDPMTPLRWTSKSLRGLADQLSTQGHRVSATLVGRLLLTHKAGYSLQANSRRWRAPSTPTATRSSATSATPSRRPWPPGCRWSAWTARK